MATYFVALSVLNESAPKALPVKPKLSADQILGFLRAMRELKD